MTKSLVIFTVNEKGELTITDPTGTTVYYLANQGNITQAQCIAVEDAVKQRLDKMAEYCKNEPEFYYDDEDDLWRIRNYSEEDGGASPITGIESDIVILGESHNTDTCIGISYRTVINVLNKSTYYYVG